MGYREGLAGEHGYLKNFRKFWFGIVRAYLQTPPAENIACGLARHSKRLAYQIPPAALDSACSAFGLTLYRHIYVVR